MKSRKIKAQQKRPAKAALKDVQAPKSAAAKVKGGGEPTNGLRRY
jgi:hypothetical protein